MSEARRIVKRFGYAARALREAALAALDVLDNGFFASRRCPKRRLRVSRDLRGVRCPCESGDLYGIEIVHTLRRPGFIGARFASRRRSAERMVEELRSAWSLVAWLTTPMDLIRPSKTLPDLRRLPTPEARRRAVRAFKNGLREEAV